MSRDLILLAEDEPAHDEQRTAEVVALGELRREGAWLEATEIADAASHSRDEIASALRRLALRGEVEHRVIAGGASVWRTVTPQTGPVDSARCGLVCCCDELAESDQPCVSCALEWAATEESGQAGNQPEPEPERSFVCDVCGHVTLESRGAAEELPGACVDCWCRAGLVRGVLQRGPRYESELQADTGLSCEDLAATLARLQRDEAVAPVGVPFGCDERWSLVDAGGAKPADTAVQSDDERRQVVRRHQHITVATRPEGVDSPAPRRVSVDDAYQPDLDDGLWREVLARLEVRWPSLDWLCLRAWRAEGGERRIEAVPWQVSGDAPLRVSHRRRAGRSDWWRVTRIDRASGDVVHGWGETLAHACDAAREKMRTGTDDGFAQHVAAVAELVEEVETLRAVVAERTAARRLTVTPLAERRDGGIVHQALAVDGDGIDVALAVELVQRMAAGDLAGSRAVLDEAERRAGR